MTFDEYQKAAISTAVKSSDDPHLQNSIWVMGIAGEAGEIVEKWKKAIAYRQGEFTAEQHDDFVKELGDVVWYVAVLADSLGLSFDEVMQLNIKKLQDRQKRNVLKGQGDNR